MTPPTTPTTTPIRSVLLELDDEAGAAVGEPTPNDDGTALMDVPLKFTLKLPLVTMDWTDA